MWRSTSLLVMVVDMLEEFFWFLFVFDTVGGLSRWSLVLR
jgi:hypothetical protein